MPPLDQLHVFAPEAVIVAVLPEQIVSFPLVTAIVGSGFTVMAIVVVSEQPPALEPMTVNVVEEVGATFTLEPLRLPGIHV